MEQLSFFDTAIGVEEIKPKTNCGKISRIIGARNESREQREHFDFYATDPIAAEWLIKIVQLDDHIWECACGLGHLSEVFKQNGYDVKATDLIDRGYGKGGVDFLTQTEKFNGDIVTNPPYNYAQQFIEHGLSLVPDGNKVCMLLKLQFLEGQSRKKFFEQYPPPICFCQFVQDKPRQKRSIPKCRLNDGNSLVYLGERL